MTRLAIARKPQAAARRPQNRWGDDDLFGFGNVGRLFDDLFGGNGPELRGLAHPPAFVPRVDLTDTEDAYHLTVEVPGLAQGDVDIDLEGDLLTIKGEKKLEKRTGEKGRLHYERRFGSFERRLRVPEDVDREKVAAKLAHGILEVTLPKAEEAKVKSRKIDIVREETHDKEG